MKSYEIFSVSQNRNPWQNSRGEGSVGVWGDDKSRGRRRVSKGAASAIGDASVEFLADVRGCVCVGGGGRPAPPLTTTNNAMLGGELHCRFSQGMRVVRPHTGNTHPGDTRVSEQHFRMCDTEFVV